MERAPIEFGALVFPTPAKVRMQKFDTSDYSRHLDEVKECVMANDVEGLGPLVAIIGDLPAESWTDAARYGHMEVLKFGLRVSELVPDTEWSFNATKNHIAIEAARTNHSHVLEWCYANDFPTMRVREFAAETRSRMLIELVDKLEEARAAKRAAEACPE